MDTLVYLYITLKHESEHSFKIYETMTIQCFNRLSWALLFVSACLLLCWLAHCWRIIQSIKYLTSQMDRINNYHNHVLSATEGFKYITHWTVNIPHYGRVYILFLSIWSRMAVAWGISDSCKFPKGCYLMLVLGVTRNKWRYMQIC